MVNKAKQAYYQKNKECLKGAAKDYYQNNKEKVLAQKHEHYLENREEFLEKAKHISPERKEQSKLYKRQYRQENKYSVLVRFGVAQGAANHRGIAWLLTKEQYAKIVEKPCYYCNNEFGNNYTNCGSGLDRLDNSKEYELENVVSCCQKCNFVR